MRNRLISTLLAILMLLASIPVVYAAEFTDIENHWAKHDIEEAAELGLFSGVSDTSFDPQGTMTRAMFVAVLGRLEGIDRDFWSSSEMPNFFNDVAADGYYLPQLRWGVCNQIISGTSSSTFAPDEPITREQMAMLVATYVKQMGHTLKSLGEDAVVPECFSDADQISSWAVESVDFLRQYAILAGSSDGKGGMCFLPQDTATRAECAAVFCRLNRMLVKSETPMQEPTSVTLSASEVELHVGQSYSDLTATAAPEGTYSLLWRSSDTSIVTVSKAGVIQSVGAGTATVSVYTTNGLSASCTFQCTEDLSSSEEGYSAKSIRLFGKVVDDPRAYYTEKSAAQADMKQITVPVWDLDGKGGKVTKYMSVTVHKKLAASVTAIFTDIYNGEEKFPIHYLGGWTWSGKSEHTCGTAIDINPNENYYCSPDGAAIVGSYWKPGDDPYSIALDGEVAQIFAKYGFRQGAYWNSGYRDYMHFSYFGT